MRKRKFRGLSPCECSDYASFAVGCLSTERSRQEPSRRVPAAIQHPVKRRFLLPS